MIDIRITYINMIGMIIAIVLIITSIVLLVVSSVGVIQSADGQTAGIAVGVILLLGSFAYIFIAGDVAASKR